MYLPQLGHLDLEALFEDLPEDFPMEVFPGLDCVVVEPFLVLLLVIVVILTDCLAIFILLKTIEHTRVIPDL